MDGSSPRFARHLPKGMELVSLAESFERLRSDPAWGRLVDLLGAELATLDNQLDGEPLEQAKYAWLHGQRRGLLAFSDAIQTTLSQRDRWLEEQTRKHEGAESPER